MYLLYCTFLFLELWIWSLHVSIFTSKRLRSRNKVQHSTWITYLYWMYCYCSIVTVWSGFFRWSCFTGAKNLYSILSSTLHFWGSIQIIENNCTIFLPLISLTLFYITKWWYHEIFFRLTAPWLLVLSAWENLMIS